jgi:GNAT superfamily N-acetyltransferase
MRLTAARPEDAAAMTAVFLDARRDAMPYLPELHGEDEVLRWMGAAVINERQTIVAVSDEGQVIGFVALRPGHLDHLYVAPSEQGRGVGTWLLAVAKQANPGGLRLSVFQRNAKARAFYEHHGCCLVELRDGSQNEEREPDAVYDWRP